MFCTSNTVRYVFDDQPLSFCITNKPLRCTHVVTASSKPNITAATWLSKIGVRSSAAGARSLPKEPTAADRVRTPRQGCGGFSAEGAGGAGGEGPCHLPPGRPSASTQLLLLFGVPPAYCSGGMARKEVL